MKMIEVDFCKNIVLGRNTLNLFSFKKVIPNFFYQ